MTIIEQIKAEIERLKSIEYPCDNSQQATGFCDALDRMTDFFSTIEKKSETPNDLEEAAENYYEQDCPYPGEARVINNEHDVWFPSQAIEDAFKAGAKWQKEQMMKEAVEAEILLTPYPTICLDDCKDYDFKDGQNVRVIVLPKEEERKTTSTSHRPKIK